MWTACSNAWMLQASQLTRLYFFFLPSFLLMMSGSNQHNKTSGQNTKHIARRHVASSVESDRFFSLPSFISSLHFTSSCAGRYVFHGYPLHLTSSSCVSQNVFSGDTPTARATRLFLMCCVHFIHFTSLPLSDSGSEAKTLQTPPKPQTAQSLLSVNLWRPFLSAVVLFRPRFSQIPVQSSTGACNPVQSNPGASSTFFLACVSWTLLAKRTSTRDTKGTSLSME